MSIRIAINGFGRIGRSVARILAERDDITLVAINDPSKPATLAHLLRNDSVHGRFAGTVTFDDETLTINGAPVRVFNRATPDDTPWGEVGVDIVLECSGRFTERSDAARHIASGARKVLVSAPAKNADATIVMGVNDHTLTPDAQIVSNGSCTTNCLAPVAKALHEAVGIENGLMTTVHAYTSDQRLLDASHKDLRRARAAGMSMIPTSTGAAKAVALVLPELEGRLSGLAIRVPTPNVSLVDFVFTASRDTTVDEINGALKAAAEGSMRGILEYSVEPLVSIDLNGNPHSSIVDSQLTSVQSGRLVKVMAWYDNEWGFSHRMVDLLVKMAG